MNRTMCSALFVGACMTLCGCLGEYFGTTMPDRLRQQGVSAEATIINIWDTGWTVNDDPVIGMRVEVHPSDQPAFEGTINRYIVSRIGLSQFQPGKAIRVRFDPSDHTSIAVENAAESARSAAAAEALARTQAADVVQLSPDYPAPHVPGTLRGLKVLMFYTLTSGPASNESEELRMRGCREAALNLFDRIGWWLVHEPSETHDIVARGDCTTSASFLTTDTGLYVLLPPIGNGMRLETSSGELLEQLQPIARTLKCPTRSQEQCVPTVKDYASYNFVDQIVKSQSVKEFAELHAARH